MKRFLLVPSLLLAFCMVVAGNSFAADAANGAVIFKKNCAMCHNKDASKSSMSKAIIGASEDVVLASIKGESTGLNKKYQLMVKTLKKKNLSDQDISDIVAFLNK